MSPAFPFPFPIMAGEAIGATPKPLRIARPQREAMGKREAQAMKPSKIIALDDWADFPAIAAALDAMESATNAQERDAAQDQLRKAELQRDIALNLTDMWGDWEHEQAAKLGLLGAGA